MKLYRKDILQDSTRYVVDSTLLYYMRTSSWHYKKCLKTKRDNAVEEKKSIVGKKFSEVTEKKRKETTQAGYSFIYGHILDSN